MFKSNASLLAKVQEGEESDEIGIPKRKALKDGSLFPPKVNTITKMKEGERSEWAKQKFIITIS